MQEKTFFMLKPDGVKRGLEENIFSRLEAAGFNIDKKVKKSVTPEQAADLYQPHLGKKFYPGLIKFITSGPVITCQVSGENVVSRIRELMGDTDPLAAGAGTIRGDLKEEAVINEDGIIKNLVHGSDSPQSAERELAIFFGP